MGKEPTYVIGINAEENTVMVGRKEDLKELEMTVRNINLIKYNNITDGMRSITKVRYKHQGEYAILSNEGDNIKVLFQNKVEGIAPGQSAVFYEGNDVIGGGFIRKR